MHVRRTLAIALAVPALLAGCSEDPEPTPKIPEPTSSSPTPTPTESETPEAESPEDFIRRWVKAGDEMQVTGETAEYSKMSPNCKACQGFVESVEEVAQRPSRDPVLGVAPGGGGTLRRWRLERCRPPPPLKRSPQVLPSVWFHDSSDG